MIDNKKDKSHIQVKKRRPTGKIPKVGLDLMEQEDLLDVWRVWNKGKTDYTFYSPQRKTYSRIDMIWGSKSLSIKTQSGYPAKNLFIDIQEDNHLLECTGRL